ncbi:MAG: M48 family metallopeptidase [Deltaproteobacteria bacterium]|nr:M48 family metallopeptidase [Deltaproteobacteria bacterium]
MNFFEHQEKARRRTLFLVFCYLLAVVLIVLGIYAGVIATLFLLQNYNNAEDTTNFLTALKSRMLFVEVFLVTFVIIITGTIYKVMQLSRGGAAVAEMLGGRLLSPSMLTPEEKKLRNIVEEMAIASGIPVPSIYLLDTEPSINAFAAGFSPSDAVIGVTSGAITKLSRDELQGVIAHEFSHIFNGDMRLNINLMGIVHGIMLLYFIGETMVRVIARTRGRSSRSKGGYPRLAIFLLGLILMVFGAIGVFFGNIIKSAVSRQREFLADASAVQYTRNPDGIGIALQKIAGLAPAQSRLCHPKAKQASHLYFAQGVSHFFNLLFATHPDIKERIRRISPSLLAEQREMDSAPNQAQQAGGDLPVANLAANSFSSTAGNISAEHLSLAGNIINSFAGQIKTLLTEPSGTQAIVFQLFLDQQEQTVKDKQLEYLSRTVGAYIFQEVLRLEETILKLSVHQYLPLLDLATDAFKQQSAEQYQTFLSVIDALISADSKLTLREFIFRAIIKHRLDLYFSLTKPVKQTISNLGKAQDALAVILSALCYAGSSTEDQQVKLFALGTSKLALDGLHLLPVESCSVLNIEQSMDTLRKLYPKEKQKLLDTLAFLVVQDQQITITEAELLRAAAILLDCPIPPCLNVS